jgi:hypothetical protein
MSRDEARMILQAYRPGGQDANDSFFAEALAWVQNDPELAGWFAQQQAFDARITGSLQQVPVPAALKAQILAQHRSKPAAPFDWWSRLFVIQSPIAWAAAAVVLILLGLTLYRNHRSDQSSFAEYSEQMAGAAMTDPHHVDLAVGDLKSAIASLPKDSGDGDLSLPLRLAGGNGLTGCRRLTWHGHDVAMLCFMPAGGGHVDLFVAPATLFPDAPPADQPRFATNNGAPTASWTHAGETYLAVGHGDENQLRNLWSAGKITCIHLKLCTRAGRASF